MEKRRKMLSGLAIASVICSIPFLGVSFSIFARFFPAPASAVVEHNMMWSLLFLPVVQVFGLIFGHAVRRMTRKWFPMADLGLALGWVGLVIYIFFIFMISPALFSAMRQQRLALCQTNVRKLVQMCYMYAADNDGKFPHSFQVLNEAGYTIGNLTSCPAIGGRADYGLNSAATMDCPPGTPLVGDFDSSNHNDYRGNVGYVDRSVRVYDGGSYSAGSGPLENVSPEDWVRE